MSIKSSRLVKWSSWSLINESHLAARMCAHRSPPRSFVIQDGPCRPMPACHTAVGSVLGLGEPWASGGPCWGGEWSRRLGACPLGVGKGLVLTKLTRSVFMSTEKIKCGFSECVING